jgi:hypothetical protein
MYVNLGIRSSYKRYGKLDKLFILSWSFVWTCLNCDHGTMISSPFCLIFCLNLLLQVLFRLGRLIDVAARGFSFIISFSKILLEHEVSISLLSLWRWNVRCVFLSEKQLLQLELVFLRKIFLSVWEKCGLSQHACHWWERQGNSLMLIYLQ